MTQKDCARISFLPPFIAPFYRLCPNHSLICGPISACWWPGSFQAVQYQLLFCWLQTDNFLKKYYWPVV